MIQEQYVTPEVGKLLKEKGFDIPCVRHWDCDYNDVYGCDDIAISNSDLEANEYNGFSIPSQSLAMRWLREKHNIHLIIQIGWYALKGYKWQASICKYKLVIPPIDAFDYIKDFKKDSYEEVCEAAIKYCLENLV